MTGFARFARTRAKIQRRPVSRDMRASLSPCRFCRSKSLASEGGLELGAIGVGRSRSCRGMRGSGARGCEPDLAAPSPRAPSGGELRQLLRGVDGQARGARAAQPEEDGVHAEGGRVVGAYTGLREGRRSAASRAPSRARRASARSSTTRCTTRRRATVEGAKSSSPEVVEKVEVMEIFRFDGAEVEVLTASRTRDGLRAASATPRPSVLALTLASAVRETPCRRQPEVRPMKRFIEHHELARDSRFVRQDNVAVTILSQLPDDVDTVVDDVREVRADDRGLGARAPRPSRSTRSTARRSA